jgi:hypothetical protein
MREREKMPNANVANRRIASMFSISMWPETYETQDNSFDLAGVPAQREIDLAPKDGWCLAVAFYLEHPV